jgi:hypothetical protein
MEKLTKQQAKGPKPRPAVYRFWEKVNKTDTCWLWEGALNPKGYGMFYTGSGMALAHRVSYEWAFGTAPRVLDHKECVRHCVRPEHLQAVTQKQNLENLVGAHKDSKSGVRGVSWSANEGKWRAAVGHNYKTYHVGYFSDLAEAEQAVIQKRNELFTNNLKDR